MYAKRRSSLRQSLGRLLSKKSLLRLQVDKLKGRYLFRAVVRKVLEYMEWITEEPTVEEISDDVAINVKMAQQKKVEKMGLTLEDRSILLTAPLDRSTKEKTHIYELFKKLRVFKKYSDNLRESLAAVCLYQYLPPGRIIVRQDRKADNLYFIANGEVSLSRIVIDDLTGDSKEIDMGLMHPGDMFGEIALLHIIPRTATVVTKTSVDLLFISREDFDGILRCTLMEEWDILQDALVHFNYFKSWDEETIRECCILSRLKDFKPDEVLLGDGKGMVNYVHFILEGECRLIEHMLVRKRFYNNKVRYEMYEPGDRISLTEKQKCTALRKSMISNVDELEDHVELPMDYTQLMLSSRPTEKHIDVEKMSVVTTTLLDVVNEWHEITNVAAMLMREPSTISQQIYPSDVHTIFMQLCTFYRGACFGLGEDMLNRRIVSITPVRCFLIPRYWLFEHNRANIWERVKIFMDSKYPNRKRLFQEFVNNRKWANYKKNLVDDIVMRNHRTSNNATIHDVPYSIRIMNQADS
ncbi:hypothetical protein KM043_005340 [Ampulex compressa]|nr:hypothetical protein KM043_005340 [Ampulex compressa]